MARKWGQEGAKNDEAVDVSVSIYPGQNINHHCTVALFPDLPVFTIKREEDGFLLFPSYNLWNI